jgi:hypothetical protein
MQLAAGHHEGSPTLHLTHTTLFAEALCGARVSLQGEPEHALICEHCLAEADAAGADVSLWLERVEVVVALPLAA